MAAIGITVGGNRGEINIAGGDIYKGYTAEQVSILLTKIATEYELQPFDGLCPYKGLDVFRQEDAEMFFGREKIVADLACRFSQSRTLFVTGPSGRGKSSLVRGNAPRVETSAIKNRSHWLHLRESRLQAYKYAQCRRGCLHEESERYGGSIRVV